MSSKDTEQTTLRTQSGRTLDELSMEAVLAGRLTPDDFRISDETLRQQADASEAAGYVQLAQNLRRAAELTRISNEQVFEIYDKLRPGRATYEELVALADQLQQAFNAPLVAGLVREAAEVYLNRGLVQSDDARRQPSSARASDIASP